MELRNLYQQLILEHARYKQGFGIEKNNINNIYQFKESYQVNSLCGDEVKIRVYFSKTNIKTMKWEGFGCAICLASASILSQLINNITISKFKNTFNAFKIMLGLSSKSKPKDIDILLNDAIVFSGIKNFQARIKCAILPWIAANDAINKIN